MLNVKINKKMYHVDLENKIVYNHNGGKLRKQEKIDEILETAKRLKETRENASNLIKNKSSQ